MPASPPPAKTYVAKKVLYQLSFLCGSGAQSYHKTVFIYTTHKSDSELVILYRRQNQNEKSRFVIAYPLDCDQLILP